MLIVNIRALPIAETSIVMMRILTAVTGFRTIGEYTLAVAVVPNGFIPSEDNKGKYWCDKYVLKIARATAINETLKTANHFPSTICERLAGTRRRFSSVCRSFSPAVLSIAA